MSIGGRSKVGTRGGARPGVAQSGNPGNGASGITWPLKGSRPSIPIEDWRPLSEMGLVYGAQIGSGDVAVLTHGGAKVWWSEGGVGFGYFTGSTEPDWTASSPITDGDKTWYEATLTYSAWPASTTISEPTFVFKEGVAWAALSWPGVTGSSEPDWAAGLGAVPFLTADLVADNGVNWWPFPPPEVTITLDPLYGHAIIKALDGLDALRASNGDDSRVTTAITSTLGIRFDVSSYGVFLTSDDGSSLTIAQADPDAGEGATPNTTTAGHTVITTNTVHGLLDVVAPTGPAQMNIQVDPIWLASILRSTGAPLLFRSDPSSSHPTANSDLASTIEWHIDEGTNTLKVRVIYADGSTVKTGEVPLF